MKKEIWVVVANSSRAHIFKAEGNQKLSLVNSMEHPESRLRPQDLIEGKPGHSNSTTGAVRHAMETRADPKDVESIAFAKEIVQHLETSQGQIEKIYFSASPIFLGQVRPLMNKHLHGLIAGEVTKDLTTLKPDEIRTHFPYVL
jgi:protein required for attachment to host cells